MSHRMMTTVAILSIALFLTAQTASADECVPFRGAGTATFEEFISPTTAVFFGGGEATQLGHYSSTALVEFENGVPVGASITFVAANSDTLEIETFGVLDPDTGEIISMYSVTGGTGRFAGATGGGLFDAVDNPDGASVSTSWDGVICLDR
jgi:outer membrane protein assembly factor BamB